METKLEKLGAAEFLAKFDAEFHGRLREVAGRPGVDAVVLFENLTLDSTAVGQRTAMIVGPGCTYESVNALRGEHLGDQPSQRQYPVAYVAAEDLRS